MFGQWRNSSVFGYLPDLNGSKLKNATCPLQGHYPILLVTLPSGELALGLVISLTGFKLYSCVRLHQIPLPQMVAEANPSAG